MVWLNLAEHLIPIKGNHLSLNSFSYLLCSSMYRTELTNVANKRGKKS